jgi:hypothetical protein
MVKAVYTDDEASLNRFRLKAEIAGAELLADAYYTAFVLSGGAPTPSVVQKAADENRETSCSSGAGQMTRLQWPGIEVWVGHPLQSRHPGKNAPVAWSATQSEAVLNFEFGLREAVRTLGLDAAVSTNGLGQIVLKGIASDPLTGVGNFPPNFQMILRWPPYGRAEAPHFEIDRKGLLTECSVTVEDMPQLETMRIRKEQIFQVNDYHGDPLWETLITAEGGLSLRRAGGGECSLKPVGSGFAEGTTLVCTGKEAVQVTANVDTVHRQLRVRVGSHPPELYSYDRVDSTTARPSGP